MHVRLQVYIGAVPHLGFRVRSQQSGDGKNHREDFRAAAPAREWNDRTGYTGEDGPGSRIVTTLAIDGNSGGAILDKNAG